MSGRIVLEPTSYSTEWAEQSVELGRHLPFGREMLEIPKSVRSYITTRSLGRSCMCMAEMPMLGRRTDHDPPTWPLGSNNMSPMTRAKGIVSMTH
uniref:Uncharacterized protein n=1 Tax=Helianthus annuus TaxID=4232 RepID=A0A251TYK7_HELAN